MAPARIVMALAARVKVLRRPLRPRDAHLPLLPPIARARAGKPELSRAGTRRRNSTTFCLNLAVTRSLDTQDVEPTADHQRRQQ